MSNMERAYEWSEVEPHIIRHDSGCWTWDGFPVDGNVYRIIAEACGSPLPEGQKLFRMPGCELGKPCVNPAHLGTSVDYVLSLNGRRVEVAEPPSAVRMVRLTKQDRQFLKSLRIRW